MSRVTFYRKYRSNTFDKIIGQEHIIQTLTNAIEFNRLSHAYIFSGPRGTGKTSMARILAKSINCRKGKSARPCLTCDLCEKIAKSNSVDVIEIDAASNTGVDNIRSLNEQINFTPVECLYKIFIIDEVHMLSAGAFNALLKTLEEPPTNTIFILATTEPQKIPATIHSRCQRLQFRRLTNQEIAKQLKIITENEKIDIPESGITLIAKNANGGMRDAISLLDQIYSFKGNTITNQDILLILGTSNLDSLYDLIWKFIQQDIKQSMTKLQEILDSGINIAQFLSDITEIFEQLIFIKIGLKTELDVDESHLAQLSQISENITLEQLQNFLKTFAQLEMEIRQFPNPELLLKVKFLTQIYEQSDQLHPTPHQPKLTVSTTTKQSSITTADNAQIKSQNQPITTPKAPPKNQNQNEPITPKPSTEPPVSTAQNNTEKTEPTTAQSNDTQWNTVIQKIKDIKKPLFFMLENSKISTQNETNLVIKIKENSYKDFILKDKSIIEDEIQKVFNNKLNLTIEASGKNAQLLQTTLTNPSNSGNITQADNTPDPKSKKINELIEIFEGTIL